MSKFQFDHRTIEDLALEERYYVDSSGAERIAKVVNRGKLRKLIKERAEEGRELMEPFRLWCITYKGLSAQNAARKAAAVYNSIWETHNRPWELLLRDDILKLKKDDLKRCLTLFGEWLSTNGNTDEDQEWGRRVLRNTSRIRSSTGKRMVKSQRRKARGLVEPLTHDEWNAIFKAIEKWHKKRGASAPWARSFFRMRFKLALHASQTSLYYLKRQDIAMALDDLSRGRKNAVVKLWTDTKLVRVVPIRLVKKELQALVDFPVPWGILADIICPFRDTPDERVQSCPMKVTNTWRKIVEGSGGLVQSDSAWYKRAKLAAVRAAWEKTHDKILLQSIFGYSQNWLNKMDFLD